MFTLFCQILNKLFLSELGTLVCTGPTGTLGRSGITGLTFLLKHFMSHHFIDKDIRSGYCL